MEKKPETPKNSYGEEPNAFLTFIKSDKFQMFFYPIVYFLLTIGLVVVGCFIFSRNYYTNVYVSGGSMSPTLIGGENGRYHYGISDNHRKAVKNLERFDVVVTYYPKSWNSDDAYKIKRVWGFPNETITMSFDNTNYTYTFEASKNGEVIYSTNAITEDIGLGYKVATFVTARRTFHTHATNTTGYLRTNYSITLKANEYFLMGDNWSSSSDSFAHLTSPDKVTFDMIQGRMIAIQGTAKISNGELYDKQRIKEMYYF